MLSRRAVLNFRAQVRLRAPIHSTALRRSEQLQKSSESHTADSYSKDIDYTPPEDTKIHRVDSSSENAQKPHEAPSGQWSQAGVKTSEYQSRSTETATNDAAAPSTFGEALELK